MSTVEMKDCASQAYDQVSADLTRTLAALQRKLGHDAWRRLKKSQTSWETYRADYCDAVRSQGEGGSLAPVDYLLCLETMTDARYRTVVEDYSADLDTPPPTPLPPPGRRP